MDPLVANAISELNEATAKTEALVREHESSKAALKRMRPMHLFMAGVCAVLSIWAVFSGMNSGFISFLSFSGGALFWQVSLDEILHRHNNRVGGE